LCGNAKQYTDNSNDKHKNNEEDFCEAGVICPIRSSFSRNQKMIWTNCRIVIQQSSKSESKDIHVE
jgi:hypothetical protein